VQGYRDRYPDFAERFHFIPTWMDPEIFYPLDGAEQNRTREELNRQYGFSNDDQVLVSVGRLDTQKDPFLLLEAFRIVLLKNPRVRLLYIGNGVLRAKLERFVRRYGLKQEVALGGLRSATEVARYLQAADLFVLSSAYEGMPMCILEALGSGLPVATTDVGEVSRMVHPGRNGEITKQRDPTGLAAAIERCLANVHRYRGEPCVRSVRNYTPEKTLASVYENYRRLAAENRL